MIESQWVEEDKRKEVKITELTFIGHFFKVLRFLLNLFMFKYEFEIFEPCQMCKFSFKPSSLRFKFLKTVEKCSKPFSKYKNFYLKIFQISFNL